jgi:hypothetical protein
MGGVGRVDDGWGWGGGGSMKRPLIVSCFEQDRICVRPCAE